MRTGGRLSGLVVVLILGCNAISVQAASPEQVDAAIKRGVDYLYRTMSPDLLWEKVPAPDAHSYHVTTTGGQWGGCTAMAVLTLLGAGEEPSDPRLAKAIDFLKQADLVGNYAISMRAQVWPYLPMTPDNKAMIRRDCEILLNAIHTSGPAAGFYSYLDLPWKADPDRANWYDHSNSQIAVLAVWALAETDVVEVPTAYWELVDRAWKSQQWADGGWGYLNDPTAKDEWTKHTINMTAAGAATLLITQDYLRQNADCTGNWDSANIEAAIKFMMDHINDAYGPAQMIINEFPNGIKYYGIYGVERVGAASGRKYFGTYDWYKAASDRLVGEQGADGGWSEQLPDTCLALLTLIHGRSPVAINKLEYKLNEFGDKPKAANWNERPRDAANFSRWLGHMEELEYHWQIVNLEVGVDELHDAPILYISGNQAIGFTSEEENKLKQFVEDGGLILFNADCGSKMFTEAVKKLGTKLFPMAEFRELPADHTIYTQEQFRRDKWQVKPSILGLSNGDRELMILVPQADLARYWQTRTYGGREERHEVAADIFQYMVTSPQLLKRGSTFIVRPEGGGGGPAIKVARLEYPGGYWDPEPSGWKRLAAIMHNRKQAELSVESVTLGDGKLSGYRIADLTGTAPIRLSEAARAEIKAFVRGGGTLIVDSCGGSTQVADSMQAELNAIFGLKDPLPILKADDAVFSKFNKIDKVEYRRYARRILHKLDWARLRGLTINGRTAVFFSPEDLSLGLVGVPVDGIYGYEPQSACDLMANMLLYGQSK